MSDSSGLVDQILRQFAEAEGRQLADFEAYGFSLRYRGQRISPEDVTVLTPFGVVPSFELRGVTRNER